MDGEMDYNKPMPADDSAQIDRLPPLKDRNGRVLCSDLVYRDSWDPRFRVALALIAKMDKEVAMYREANRFASSQASAVKTIAARA